MNCTYCGAIDGGNRDHLNPTTVSAVCRKRGQAGFHRQSWGEFVPACLECNSLLGSVLIATIEGRADYLVGVYSKRYKKLLRSPDWSDDALNDFGRSMQDTILRSRAEKAEVNRKIEFARATARFVRAA